MEAAITTERKARLEQTGNLYGEHGFAIAWTAGIEGDDAKACRRRGWETTKPEPAAFLAGVFATRGLRANPCLVLKPSGVVGIDVDGPVGAARLNDLVPGGLPLTVKVVSGRDGGAHYWFRAGQGAKQHKIEFKSDGSIKLSENGYFVAPPAIHPNGSEYRFAPGLGLGEVPLVELPADALGAILHAAGADKKERVSALSEGKRIGPGARHDALVAHAGMLRRGGLGEEAILEGLWSFFKHHCEPDPPADPNHLEQIARSASTWDPGDLPGAPVVPWWHKHTLNGNGAEADHGPYIDWSSFWTQDEAGPEWLIDNILARGRGHSIYATHKAGKSLVMLWCALEAVKSGAIVIYLDFEMTDADLRERLEDMGAGPDMDLSRLRYALLPMLPPLDTPAGGAAVLEMVDDVQRENPDTDVALIVDTISRAVEGEENTSDTIQAFYRHTGIGLKQRGVTWARLDHAGWDGSHARGSSAKGDDVDVVWKLVEVDGGRELRRDAARMGWVPEKVTLNMEQGPLRFVQLDQSWPMGTDKTAKLLDGLGVPVDAGRRAAQAALREAGHGTRAAVIDAALRWRKMGAACSTESHGTHVGTQPDGGRRDTNPDTRTDTGRTHGTQGSPDTWDTIRVPIGTRLVPVPPDEPDAEPEDEFADVPWLTLKEID